MREVEYQSLVVDVVRAQSGAATKLSNRFLIGVSDLLVKLPDCKAMLVEVKLEHAQTMNDREFCLDVTALQKKFLREYAAAGMCCGVLSFVEWRGLGRRGLHVAAFSLVKIEQMCYRVCISDHLSLIDPKTRDARIIGKLKEICR